MILEYFRIDYKTDEEKDSIFFSQNPAPFYKFNQIWRLAPPIFRIPNRKIEYTSIREIFVNRGSILRLQAWYATGNAPRETGTVGGSI